MPVSVALKVESEMVTLVIRLLNQGERLNVRPVAVELKVELKIVTFTPCTVKPVFVFNARERMLMTGATIKRFCSLPSITI